MISDANVVGSSCATEFLEELELFEVETNLLAIGKFDHQSKEM
jgi:hypothetical protein